MKQRGSRKYVKLERTQSGIEKTLEKRGENARETRKKSRTLDRLQGKEPSLKEQENDKRMRLVSHFANISVQNNEADKEFQALVKGAKTFLMKNRLKEELADSFITMLRERHPALLFTVAMDVKAAFRDEGIELPKEVVDARKLDTLGWEEAMILRNQQAVEVSQRIRKKTMEWACQENVTEMEIDREDMEAWFRNEELKLYESMIVSSVLAYNDTIYGYISGGGITIREEILEKYEHALTDMQNRLGKLQGHEQREAEDIAETEPSSEYEKEGSKQKDVVIFLEEGNGSVLVPSYEDTGKGISAQKGKGKMPDEASEGRPSSSTELEMIEDEKYREWRRRKGTNQGTQIASGDTSPTGQWQQGNPSRQQQGNPVSSNQQQGNTSRPQIQPRERRPVHPFPKEKEQGWAKRIFQRMLPHNKQEIQK